MPGIPVDTAGRCTLSKTFASGEHSASMFILTRWAFPRGSMSSSGDFGMLQAMYCASSSLTIPLLVAICSSFWFRLKSVSSHSYPHDIHPLTILHPVVSAAVFCLFGWPAVVEYILP